LPTALFSLSDIAVPTVAVAEPPEGVPMVI